MAAVDSNAFEALDLVSVPVVVVDVHESWTTFAFANEAALSAIGLSARKYEGRRPTEVFPGRSGVAAMARQLAIAKSGGTGVHIMSGWQHGANNQFEVRLKPRQINGDGVVTQMVGTLLPMAQREAEAQRDAEQFIIMAAHDLRAPMRNVTILTELLRESLVEKSPGQIELIDALDRLGDRALHLISDVLSYAQSARHQIGNTSELDFGALCEDIFSVLDPHGAHDLRAQKSRVAADPIALQIAVRNLVDNALKHGGRDDMYIEVAVRPHVDGFFEVSVQDNGTGFAEPDLTFLKDAEFRYGAGFGLLGLKQMVASRGGTLHAEEIGDPNGTVVRFTLPGMILASEPLRRDGSDVHVLAAEPPDVGQSAAS